MRIYLFFFLSRIPCRGTHLRNRVLHLNLQIDKSEIRIASNFVGIRYSENKYFEICRIIMCVSPAIYICYILCNYSTLFIMKCDPTLCSTGQSVRQRTNKIFNSCSRPSKNVLDEFPTVLFVL